MFLVLAMLLTLIPGCQFAIADKEPLVEISENTILKYHFADKDEAVSCYLSNDDYFNGFSEYDIQYKTQDKNGTIEFFDVMATAIIPVDGSDKYYLQEDASNFWDIFGENTDYVIDPEECMADNFSFALTYGKDGKEYNNPEIIEAIIDYLKK